MQNLTAGSVILLVAFMFCMVKLFMSYRYWYITDIAECLIIKFVLCPEPKQIIKFKLLKCVLCK